MSLEVLGPGMMPQSKRLHLLKRSAGLRLRLIRRRGHTVSVPTLKSARPSVLKASAISRGSLKKPFFGAPYATCHPNNLELRPTEYLEAIVDIPAEPGLSMCS